jgi:CRP-like cAMP-binding protein
MDIQQRAVLLRETALFEQLDDAALHRLADRMVHRVFERGQSIFVQDELGDRLFIIAEGSVRLLVRSRSAEAVDRLLGAAWLHRGDRRRHRDQGPEGPARAS